MGDVRRIRRGQTLKEFTESGDFRAGWDALAELHAAYTQDKWRRESQIKDYFAHPAVVEVANTTGKDLVQFSVVQLATAPMIDPTANLLSFQQRPNFLGIVPTTPVDLNRWVVLLEPVAKQGTNPAPFYGHAAVAGVVSCQVFISNVAHDFCGPLGGQTGYLQSGPSGPGILLSTPRKLGLQWCQVYMRCCSPPPISGSVSGSGGITALGGPGCACCADVLSAVCLDLTGCLYPDCHRLCGSTVTLPQGPYAQTWYQLFGDPATGAAVGIELSCETYDNQAAHVLRFLGSSSVEWTFVSHQCWDCASPLVLTKRSGSLVGACWSIPDFLVITPGACGSGGGGGGGSNCDCTGDCSGHSSLAATFTNKVGGWVAMPDSATLACNAAGGSATHAWANASPPTVFGQTQSSPVNCGASGTGAPQYLWTDAGGHNHAVTSQSGYNCNPLSAVFLIDDGAGDTMTVTVVE